MSMQSPDYIYPIVGYRRWLIASSALRLPIGARQIVGLTSLNHQSWTPGKPMEASCWMADRQSWKHLRSYDLYRRPAPPAHQEPPPIQGCTCGVYAWKYPDELMFHKEIISNVTGEVWLWGRVFEHEYGWKAQYAYPKSFTIAPNSWDRYDWHSKLGLLLSFDVDIWVGPSEYDHRLGHQLRAKSDKELNRSAVKLLNEYFGEPIPEENRIAGDLWRPGTPMYYGTYIDPRAIIDPKNTAI